MAACSVLGSPRRPSLRLPAHVPARLRWLAKRISPPEVQAAAHVAELAERHGRAFRVCLITLDMDIRGEGAHC